MQKQSVGEDGKSAIYVPCKKAYVKVPCSEHENI